MMTSIIQLGGILSIFITGVVIIRMLVTMGMIFITQKWIQQSRGRLTSLFQRCCRMENLVTQGSRIKSIQIPHLM